MNIVWVYAFCVVITVVAVGVVASDAAASVVVIVAVLLFYNDDEIVVVWWVNASCCTMMKRLQLESICLWVCTVCYDTVINPYIHTIRNPNLSSSLLDSECSLSDKTYPSTHILKSLYTEHVVPLLLYGLSELTSICWGFFCIFIDDVLWIFCSFVLTSVKKTTTFDDNYLSEVEVTRSEVKVSKQPYVVQAASINKQGIKEEYPDLQLRGQSLSVYNKVTATRKQWH